MSEIEVKNTSPSWYVWRIRSDKLDVVKRFIEEEVPEINKVLHPTVTEEKSLKSGKVKKKKSPLYAGYIFLNYEEDQETRDVWVKLKSHPFITQFVGPCTPSDLASVESLEKVEEINDERVKQFLEGDSVRVNGGPLKGLYGSVIGCSTNTVRVEIEVFGRTTKAVFSPEDLDILKRNG